MIPVLVTTQHRGVFCGLVDADQDLTARTLSMKSARCAIRFGTEHGFAQLAATGPTEGSKIGSPADYIALHDITAKLHVTPEAWEKWQNS